MTRIVAVSGSYRPEGFINNVVKEVLNGAKEAGAETRFISLLDHEIAFCTNCRTCMQSPGSPTDCVQEDAMAELFDEVINADGLVLASPVNMGAVTAIFKRFAERLSPTAYWPWDRPAPVYREGIKPKRAVLVASSAAPAILWRIGGYGALGTLRTTAKVLNAKVVCVLKYGLVARPAPVTLTEKQREKARSCGRALVR